MTNHNPRGIDNQNLIKNSGPLSSTTASGNQTHKTMTRIAVLSSAASALILFTDMFIQFLRGYKIIYQEPNLIIAGVELVWTAYCVVYVLILLNITTKHGVDNVGVVF